MSKKQTKEVPAWVKEANTVVMKNFDQWYVDYVNNSNAKDIEEFLATFYDIYKSRSEMEPDTLKMEDFIKHVEKFDESGMTSIDYVSSTILPYHHLATFMNTITKKELYDLTRIFQIPNCSRANKDELIQILCDYYVSVPFIEEHLSFFDEDCINLLRKVVEKGVYQASDRELSMVVAMDLPFLRASVRHAYIVDDARGAFDNFDWDDLEEKRVKKNYYEGVRITFLSSYGALHESELLQLLQQNPILYRGGKTDEDILNEFMELSKDSIAKEGDVYMHRSFLEDKTALNALLGIHEKLPLGIPSIKEMESAGCYGYANCLKEYSTLYDVLERDNDDAINMHAVISELYHIIAQKNNPNYALARLQDLDLYHDETDIYNAMIDVYYATRILEYHGMNPKEYEAWMKKQPKPKEKKTKQFVPYSQEALAKKQQQKKLQELTNGNPFAYMLFEELNKNKK